MQSSEKSANASTPLLYLLFLVLSAGYAAFYKVGLGDFWMHLAQGRYIVEHGTIPRVDVFSYTFPGEPWINWEWLHNVIIALVWNSSGAVGVEFFRMAVFCLTIVVLYRLLERMTGKALFSFFLSCFSLLMIQLRIVDRPHILSYLFLSLVLYLLACFERFSLKKFFFPLAIVLVLWRNTHPSWVLGCAVVGASFLDMFLAFRRSGQSEKILKILPWLLLLLLIGVFTTPLPIQFSAHLALQGDQSIAEWGSILSLRREMLGLEMFLFFLFSLLSLLVIPAGIRARPFSLILFLVMLGNAYLHFRFIPDAVILGMPLLASSVVRCATLFSSRIDERLLVILFFVLTVLGSDAIFRVAQFPERGIGIDDRFVPLHAADFARQKNLSGNFYGMYPYSMDFLMGYLYPQAKVALDARVPGLYPFSFADTHWHIANSEQFRERALSLPLSYVLLGNTAMSPPSPREPILERLLLQEGYVLIYFDRTSALYRSPRADEKNGAVTSFKILTRWNMNDEVLEKVVSNSFEALLAEVRLLKENTRGRDDFYREMLVFLYTRPFFSEEQKKTLEKVYARSD